MIEQIKAKAKELLESKKVNVVIGYENTSLPNTARPSFATKPEDVDKFVWNKFCFDNLTRYITHHEMKRYDKIAIVVKGCDANAAAVLVQESQIEKDNLYLIGVTCEGVGEPQFDKCNYCEVTTPKFADEIIGDKVDPKTADAKYQDVETFSNKEMNEKWNFWKNHFERCIKCYACRQACPMCFCNPCIVEKSQPQWIDTSAHTKGNFSWNIIRAFHLASRCVECGECERVCPADIPLMLINKKLAKTVNDFFDYKAGEDHEAEPPLCTYKQDDNDDFIK